jgi:hypothetical protein
VFWSEMEEAGNTFEGRSIVDCQVVDVAVALGRARDLVFSVFQ